MRKLVLVLLAFCCLLRAHAADPALEHRADALAAQLRCLVCQNQSLADSNARLALDLKQQIHTQLAAGRSDQQVIDFMVARYGDFVLYRPPFNGLTWLLWCGPFLLLAGGLLVLLRARRAVAVAAAPPPEQLARVAALLDTPLSKESA